MSREAGGVMSESWQQSMRAADVPMAGRTQSKPTPRRRESHIFKKEAHGHYVDEAWCSQRLLEAEKFGNPAQVTICDFAVGWGTITDSARQAGYNVVGFDIIDRRRHELGSRFHKLDFLTDPLPAIPRPFAVVCNPPADHIEAFCRRAVASDADRIAMIMLARRLNAAHWLQELPLRRIWLLTPRPSMPPGSYIAAGKKPGGGKQDFCWLIFERGFTGKPELGWLHRDGRSA
jgi:hypothetical protein